jgi:predicted acyltransferase (DUF342 family)
MKSTLNVSKAVTMASTLAVTGQTTLSGDVSLNSNVDISGDLVINGNLSVNQQQNTSVINTTVNDYQLIVTEDLSLNGKLSASGDVSLNADVDISGNLEVKNFTYFNNHVYPTTDDAIDIGSPDFKIRDLYLSTSSLWLGDDHKIDVSGGEMKFRKRKTSQMPKVFSNKSIGDVRTALSLDESVGISDLKLGQWLQYARTIDGGVNGKTGRQLSVQDIFGKDADDYENIQDAAVGEADLSLNHDLKVGGEATFHKRVDICGNLYAQYENGSIPASAIKGSIATTGTSTSESTAISQTLDVSGATSLDSSLDVSGSATFNSTLVVNGDVSFNSTANVDVCGNFYAQYPEGSIPASAISGTISSSSVNAKNQTFFDILTQQPGKFTFDSSSNTTANLTINWNYDDIKANISGTAYQALLNFQTSSATKNLPYISSLQVDISSANATQSGWISYQTTDLTNADYNDSSYKTLTITKNTGSGTYENVLNSLDPFDVRVYGVNNSYNYPDEATRALIFTVFFKTPKAPSDPDFVSKAINSYQQSTLTYTFTEPEQGDTDSLGKLNASQTKYQENEALSSTAYAVSTTINTKTETNDNVSGGNNFTVELTSLRAGTKYNFITRVNNDLIDTYSINDTNWGNVGSTVNFDTTNGPTAFTSLPSSGSYSSAYTPTLTYNTTKSVSTHTSTTNLNNASIIYINTAGSQTVVPSNDSEQTFQITDENATTSSTKGFGKYVDNVNDLVQVKASVNDTVKQTLSYQGFTPSATLKYGTATRTNPDLEYFNDPSQNDIYTDTQRKGYRLKGIFKLLTLSNDNVGTLIGGASSTPHSLKLEYIRDSDKVGGTASTTTTSSIYVDTLSENPSATSTNTAVVTSVAWNMGIPSVKTYRIDATRTYSNMNSAYKYIRGDRKISSFDGVTKSANTSPYNTFTSQNILLSRSSISDDGSYTYNSTELATANSGVLNNLYYNASRDNTDTSLTISETLYSLKSDGTPNNTNVSVNHYYDHDSYTGFGSDLSNKLSLSNSSIYQLGSISNLGSDLSSITVSVYDSHETIPESHTLLYIGGKFQTGSYPNVISYEWNDVTSSATYNAGSTGVTTSGVSATTGTRYKWIAFKLTKNSSTEYSFNGSNYTIKTNGDGYKYLSVKDMFVTSGLFGPTTISNLFNSSSTAAIGFCRATKSGTSTNVYGYFKNDFDTTQTWSSVGTGAGDYSSLTAAKYGCKVEGASNDYGIQISSTALNDDLHVFIGLEIEIS